MVAFTSKVDTYTYTHAHPIRHSTERRFADEFVISSEVENGATGKSEMDGCAARAAARESGDERVKSLTVFSELMEDIQNKELRFFDSAQNDR